MWLLLNILVYYCLSLFIFLLFFLNNEEIISYKIEVVLVFYFIFIGNNCFTLVIKCLCFILLENTIKIQMLFNWSKL